jgi:hypothetical protein
MGSHVHSKQIEPEILVTTVQLTMDNRRISSLIHILLLASLCLLLFSGHRYKALDQFMSNSITNTLESVMIKACIAPPDVEDPKGYD